MSIFLVMDMRPDGCRDMWAFADLHSAFMFCANRFGVKDIVGGWEYHDSHGPIWIAKDVAGLTIDELEVR